jgi:hypothetical protein
MTVHTGGCHCSNIRLGLSTELDPSQIEVRACQCSFCVRHGSRAVADPDGRLIISVKDEARLRRYQFGLRTADYLICRECGVYVAAIDGKDDAISRDDDARAIVIINALNDRSGSIGSRFVLTLTPKAKRSAKPGVALAGCLSS